MTSIEEIHKATRLLDVIGASKTQIIFCPENEYEKRYGFIFQPLENTFMYYHLEEVSKIKVISTWLIDGYTFVFIDPRQINNTKPTT